MTPRTSPLRSLAILAVAGLLIVPAASAVDEPLARVQQDVVGVDLFPAFQGAAGWSLTVAGPQGYFAETTTGDDYRISIDAAGLADGRYNWELTPVLPQRSDVRDDRYTMWTEEAPRQFGSFRIVGGQVITADLVEEAGATGGGKGDRELEGNASYGAPAFARDIQHQDDVIIFFSLCVGNDCVNGESFGFDTQRLKENNLRMHFQDTSNTASFPSNDWRFVFNDTSNGGDNYFAVEDSTAGRQPFRVDAGAPASSLYVDSGGDVGIGTSNPVVNLHVKEGNTPTLRLEQDGSSGFTPQTWDLAGNEANFFLRDVTNGSELPIKVKPGADTGALFIAANNSIGMGTESPGAALHVRRTDGTSQLFVEEASGTESNSRIMLQTTNNGAVQYSLNDTSGDGADWRIQSFQGQFRLASPGLGALMTVTTDGDLTVAGDCIQIGANACTVSGGSLSCTAGTC